MIEKLQQEFSFFQNNEVYYNNLINNNPKKSYSILRKKIISEIRKSIYEYNFSWLLDLFKEINLNNLLNILNLLKKYNIYLDIDILSFIIDIYPSLASLLDECLTLNIDNEELNDLLKIYINLKERIDDNSYNYNNSVVYGSYFKEVYSIPILNQKEVIKIYKRIENIENNAKIDLKEKEKEIRYLKNKVIEGNLRLVLSYLKKYKYLTYIDNKDQYLDLVQLGNEGLVKAADHYDYKSGTNFSSYAIYWIRSALSSRHNDFDQLIVKPVWFRNNLNKYKTTEMELMFHLGDYPSLELIAKEMNIPLDIAKMCQYYAKQEIISLNSFFTEDEQEKNLMNVIPSADINFDEELIIQEDSKILKAILTKISPRSENIIRLYYGIPKDNDDNFDYSCKYNFAKIGNKINLSRERVRVLFKGAIDEVRREYFHIYDIKLDINAYQSFWQNFDGIDSDIVFAALKKLSLEEMKCLIERFGYSLDDNKMCSISLYKDAYYIILKLQNIIKDIINNTLVINNVYEDLTKLTLYNYLNISIDELEEFLSKPIFHNPKLKGILTKAYGINYNLVYQNNLNNAELELLKFVLKNEKEQILLKRVKNNS